jgi:hypothetical protein
VSEPETITGYRELSPEEIEIINGIKETGNRIGVMLTHLREREGIDARMLNIAATYLQLGFMCATRAVANPEGFA